jgi:hypothetical protein
MESQATEELQVELLGVRDTFRSVEHRGESFHVLKVSLMIQVASKAKSEFKGLVYPQSVELLSDSGDIGEDELKDLMASIASEWDEQFKGWEATVTREESL